jgi:hypothetical protein
MSRRNALTVASALSDDIGEQLRREQLVGWSTRKAYTDPSGTRWRHQVAASIWASVAVTLEADDLGVVDQSVDHGRGDHVVGRTPPQRPNGLFEVTIRLARSWRTEPAGQPPGRLGRA